MVMGNNGKNESLFSSRTHHPIHCTLLVARKVENPRVSPSRNNYRQTKRLVRGDTVLMISHSHPGDNIPPMFATTADTRPTIYFVFQQLLRYHGPVFDMGSTEIRLFIIECNKCNIIM